MAFTLSDFSELQDDPNQGLGPTTFLESEPKITAFREIVTNQPPFFISRANWELLANGKRRVGRRTESWLTGDYEGYEVYAFVFCVAFGKGGGYFRVRTILKKINSDNKSTPILLDTKNIAFVNIKTAYSNQRTGRSNNCLEFLTPADRERRAEVDSQVIRKGSYDHKNPYHPAGFLNVDKNIIENEGNYFGKKRIWDEILVKTYPSKNTNIFLTLEAEKNIISFNFKINDEYETGIKCPFPSVCN